MSFPQRDGAGRDRSSHGTRVPADAASAGSQRCHAPAGDRLATSHQLPLLTRKRHARRRSRPNSSPPRLDARHQPHWLLRRRQHDHLHVGGTSASRGAAPDADRPQKLTPARRSPAWAAARVRRPLVLESAIAEHRRPATRCSSSAAVAALSQGDRLRAALTEAGSTGRRNWAGKRRAYDHERRLDPIVAQMVRNDGGDGDARARRRRAPAYADARRRWARAGCRSSRRARDAEPAIFRGVGGAACGTSVARHNLFTLGDVHPVRRRRRSSLATVAMLDSTPRPRLRAPASPRRPPATPRRRPIPKATLPAPRCSCGSPNVAVADRALRHGFRRGDHPVPHGRRRVGPGSRRSARWSAQASATSSGVGILTLAEGAAAREATSMRRRCSIRCPFAPATSSGTTVGRVWMTLSRSSKPSRRSRGVERRMAASAGRHANPATRMTRAAERESGPRASRGRLPRWRRLRRTCLLRLVSGSCACVMRNGAPPSPPTCAPRRC